MTAKNTFNRHVENAPNYNQPNKSHTWLKDGIDSAAHDFGL